MSADDTTVAGALATPSITHRAAPFCREKPEPVTATALGVPAVEARRGVTAATTPAGSPAASPNAEGPRAMTLVIDSRVIIGTALGARSLMPVSTHAGEGTPRDGLPAGVARRRRAPPRRKRLRVRRAPRVNRGRSRRHRPEATRHLARARARARAQEERHRRAARLRRRERRRRVRPRRRRRDSRRRQRLGRGAGARATPPTRGAPPRRRTPPPPRWSPRRAPRPRRARGASHVRIAEETNRAPRVQRPRGGPRVRGVRRLAAARLPSPREKERAPRPLGESRRLRGGGRDDEAPAAGVAGARRDGGDRRGLRVLENRAALGEVRGVHGNLHVDEAVETATTAVEGRHRGPGRRVAHERGGVDDVAARDDAAKRHGVLGSGRNPRRRR